MRKTILFSLLTLGLMSCNNGKRYHDSSEKTSTVTTSDTYDFESDIQIFQNRLNAEYMDPESSPLYDRHRVDFKGLDFFEPDSTYRVIAFLRRTPNATPFMMSTINNTQKNEERVYGVLEFQLKGQQLSLEVYQSTELMEDEDYADYLFLPFTDLTNTDETYGGGRYIDLRIPEQDSIVVDFNKAYNPYCAYNTNYVCPKVPKVNHLPVEIKAGVKKFKN